jgi:tight adherence protein B
MTGVVVVVLTLLLAWSAALARVVVAPAAARHRLADSRGPALVPPWRGSRERWRTRHGARERKLVAELPTALDAVGRSLRSGRSLHQAIDDVARASPTVAASALGSVALAAARGRPLRDACWALAPPGSGRPLRQVAGALQLAATAGGRPALAVDAVAASLREQAALARDVDAQSVQARLSALVIGLLPLCFTGWCVLTDERMASFLLGSRAGWTCLVVGFGLEAVGVLWTLRLVRGAR